MSQISPPIRIVLVAAVAFLAAWMLFLRPKAEVVPPQPAPAASTAPAKQPGTSAQSTAGQLVQKAENAKATAESAAKARAGESAAPAATAAPGAPASKPAATGSAALDVDPAALASLPAGVRKALVARKIVVLGFFNGKALDDHKTETQLDKTWTFHGRASVHRASISDVQRYAVITRGVDVTQSPSIVVIDRNRKAQLLTGYVDHLAIEQAIVDAMRRSGMAVIANHYLRQVNNLCQGFADGVFVTTEPGVDSSFRSYLSDERRVVSRFKTRMTALHAPAGYGVFKAGMLRDVGVLSGYLSSAQAAFDAKSLPRLLAVVDHGAPRIKSAGQSFTKRARQHDLLACMYG
jgi:hypothetical protein